MEFQVEKEDEYYQINCYNDGNLIGFLNYKICKDSVWLNKIAVNKKYRNHGIGSALIKIFENQCFDNYKKVVEGKFYPEDEDCKKVLNFYLNNGYSVSKEGYNTEIYKNLDYRPSLEGLKINKNKIISR